MKKLLFLLCISSSSFAVNIDPSQISVSGLSSGAYMAGQLAIAHSSKFMGLGLFAGGPYYCAQNSVSSALSQCMDTTQPSINVANLVAKAQAYETDQLIDSTSNLKRMKIFAFSGTHDQVVSRKLVSYNFDFFKSFGVSEAQFKFDSQINAGHAFPTLNYGNSCETLREPPFISSCNYDGAGQVLNHIYGELNPRGMAKAENYFVLPQVTASVPDPMAYSMGAQAVIYVPTNCQKNTSGKPLCKLHVAIHGCRQTLDDIGGLFVEKTGYVDWAEANNIVLMFPQAIHSPVAGNPQGCWDWWGYSSPLYTTKKGPQVQMIYELVELLGHTEIKSLSHWKN